MNFAYLRINHKQLDTRHKESWNLHPLKTSGLVWGLGISVFLGYTSILQQSGPTVEKIHGLCCSCSPPWQAKPADVFQASLADCNSLHGAAAYTSIRCCRRPAIPSHSSR